MAKNVLRCAALVWASASALSTQRFAKECRVLMRNHEDVDFTIALDIGGQVVRAIPDTGSFAMVLFSDSCGSCGERKNLLHPTKLQNFSKGTHHAVQNYGSGETYSADAYAPARVNCDAGNGTGPAYIQAKEQMFWMTVRANLPVAEESSFQGILGLGPPRSDEVMAAGEAEEAVREVDEMASRGIDVEQYKPVVDNLKDVAEFTKTQRPWLENQRLTMFSVCLRGDPGQDGILIYNDRATIEAPSLFTQIIMDRNGPYWQTSFSSVKLGGAEESDRILTSGTAQAILDTGTSLMGAPSWFVDAVVGFVKARLPELGCDDVSKWPDLRFTLGGVQLSLPASSYLGRIKDDAFFVGENPRLYGLMPHLKGGTTCTALVFSTSEPETGESKFLQHKAARGAGQGLDIDAPEWILGLPFFRKYYTSFHLSKEATTACRVFLAEADENCQPRGKPGSTSGSTVEERRVVSKQRLVGPMAIDPRKLRFPPRIMFSKKSKRLEAAERV